MDPVFKCKSCMHESENISLKNYKGDVSNLTLYWNEFKSVNLKTIYLVVLKMKLKKKPFSEIWMSQSLSSNFAKSNV